MAENRRLLSGKMARRTVLHLGEINDSQEAAWRKTLDAFDKDGPGPTHYRYFPRTDNSLQTP